MASRRCHHHRGTAIGNPFVGKTTCRKWLPAGHEPPTAAVETLERRTVDVVSISFRHGKAASASGSGRALKCMKLGADSLRIVFANK